MPSPAGVMGSPPERGEYAQSEAQLSEHYLPVVLNKGPSFSYSHRHPTDWLDATRRASGRRGEPVLQRRVAWADLLQRVFEVDALACPKCGGRMRVLSAITDPTVAGRILRCLALPARAPPLATAREKVGPPDSVGEFSSELIPEFDFDPSEPSDDYEHSH